MAKRQSTSRKMSTPAMIIAALGVFALLASVGTAAYFAGQGKEKPTKTIVRTQTVQPVAQQQVRDCDDGNIVGMAVGGVAGGLLGNQVGKGSGNTAATIGGAVGGAYLGKEYIPTHNVACR